MSESKATGTLAEKIRAAQPQPRTTELAEWIATLSSPDRAALETVARDRAWSLQAILDLVKGENVRACRDTIAKWRKSFDVPG